MIYEQLEANMLADLSRTNSNSVMNELKSLGLKFPKARKGFAVVFNKYEELSRQIREGEILRPQAVVIVRQLIGAVADYVNWAVSGDPELNPGYENIQENDNLNPESTTQIDPSNMLLKFEASKSQLQAKLLKHHHVIAYAPIIPMCKPSLIREKLNKAGIKNESYNLYTILESQLVLGMSNQYIHDKKMEYGELNEAYHTLRQCGQMVAKYRLSSNDAKSRSDAALEKQSRYLVACIALKKCAINIASQRKSDAQSQKILQNIRGLRVDRNAADRAESEKQAYALLKILKLSRDMYAGPITDESLMKDYLRAASNVLKKDLTQVGGMVNYLDATWVWALTQKEMNILQSCAFQGHFSLTRWGFSFLNEDDK